MGKTKSLVSIQNQEFKHDKIVYLNDIWLALIISAIYLLFWPIGFRLASDYGLDRFAAVYWLLGLVFILVVIRDALNSKAYIDQANKSRLAKIQSEEKHTDGYTERVRKQIEGLDDLLMKIKKQNPIDGT